MCFTWSTSSRPLSYVDRPASRKRKSSVCGLQACCRIGEAGGGRADLFRLFRFYPFDEFGRVAAYHSHRWYVVRHYTVGAYNGTVTDAHARQDGRVDAYPDFVFNNDGPSVGGTAVFRIGIVVDGNEVHFWRDEHIVSDCDAPAVAECAALLNPAAFAEADVLPVVHIEGRKQRDCLVDLLPNDARKETAHFFGRVVAVVESVGQFH